MKVTVDRVEANFLVVITDDGDVVNLELRLCPEAKEGDIIKIDIERAETENRREEIESKFSRLKNLSSGI